MELTSDVKNLAEVIKVLEDAPNKMLELIDKPGAFDKWIADKSKELDFDFVDYL